MAIKNEIICGDSMKVLPELEPVFAKVRRAGHQVVIFADPPDNLGLKYDGYKDKMPTSFYRSWLLNLVEAAKWRADILWLSYYYKYNSIVSRHCTWSSRWRLFIWRFTFGQHRDSDCGNGYRPIMRWMQDGAKLYPDAIRVPSARLTKYNDKRANPKGRVPDDVWEFPRVCGTFNEKRNWHPNQHPEALMERIIKFSCVKGDLFVDMFAGTGTSLRVCKRLGIDCIGIEISGAYCKKIAEETGAELRAGQGSLFEGEK